MTYQIQVLKAGEADVRGPEVYWMSAWEDWETLYFYMLLIRGQGKTVLVNSGPPRDLTALNKAWVGYIGYERGAMRVQESERPWNALPALGVDPAEVDIVFVTPFQSYTTANLDLFPKATICLSRKGWLDFHAPQFPTSHATRAQAFPDDTLHYLSTQAWERVRLLDDEDEILPGLHSFWVGVHHRSSTALAIETSRGKVVYSDCCFKYPNLEQDRILGITESLDEAHLAYARIRKEADIFIPGYDPQVLERFPGGKVA